MYFRKKQQSGKHEVLAGHDHFHLDKCYYYYSQWIDKQFALEGDSNIENLLSTLSDVSILSWHPTDVIFGRVNPLILIKND